jgi:transaldolase
VSIWLDTLSRELLETGEFAELISDYGVTGATSNPTIFAKAITDSDRYDGQLRTLAAGGERDPQELFFSLALDDIRAAARLLRPAYEDSGGGDGFISFECTPDLADDTEATIAQATTLWRRLGQPNVMIKVPGTAAGLPAIEELTRRGVNVNITLLFSVESYDQVIDAYQRGLAKRADAGQPVDTIASVASFFLSRIDTKTGARLGAGAPARGQVALASAASPTSATGPSSPVPAGAPSRSWCQAAASPVGEHRNQEPRVLRRALRRGTDRPRRDQHDARAHTAGVRRPRHGRAHARRRPQWRGTDARRGRRSRARPGRRHAGVRARGRPLVLRLLPSDAGLHRAQDRRRSCPVATQHPLAGWCRAGEDVGVLLPRLSAYLGHRDPVSTYCHLSAAPELPALGPSGRPALGALGAA